MERPTHNEEGKKSPFLTMRQTAHLGDILHPKDMVDALLDRLQHRCCIIRIDGDSLRTPDAE